MLSFLPYERQVLETPLSKQEVIERLRQLLSSSERASDIRFVGEVFDQGFELRREIPSLPGFSLWYRGRFREATGNNTRILFIVRFPDTTLRWLTIIFSILGSFSLLLFLQFFFPFLPPIGNIIAAAVILSFILLYAMIVGFFRAEAEKGKAMLYEQCEIEHWYKPEFHFGRM